MYLCVTLPILFSFMQSHAELLEVVGSEAPLIAVAGEDLVLPCFIKAKTSAVDMTVEWYKLDRDNSLVHLYKDHEDTNENQAQTYRGRTSVFKEELQNGNTSLKLSAIRVSDEGEYKCLVEDKSMSSETTVSVIVEVQGSHPVIKMESYDHSGGINLVCESKGWKPEPEVLWLDEEGVTLPAEDTQTHRDTEGFSLKGRITVHIYSHSKRFHCRFQQQRHMMETEVLIISPLFAAWKWIVGISVSACLVAVGLIITSVLCYKKEQQKRTKENEINELKYNADQQIQRMGKEIKELEENAGVQKKRIEDQQKQKKKDDQQIKKLQDEIKELKQSPDEKQKRIEEIKKLKNNADQQIQVMEKDIKELKENAEALKKTIEEQQKQKKEDGKQIKELKDENQNLQNSSEEQKIRIEEQQKQKTKDNTQIQDLKDEIKKQKNNADQQIQAMEKDIKELKENAEGQKKRIEEQDKQKNNDDKQIKKLEEEIKKLNNNAEVQKKRIEEQQKQKNNDGNYT